MDARAGREAAPPRRRCAACPRPRARRAPRRSGGSGRARGPAGRSRRTASPRCSRARASRAEPNCRGRRSRACAPRRRGRARRACAVRAPARGRRRAPRGARGRRRRRPPTAFPCRRRRRVPGSSVRRSPPTGGAAAPVEHVEDLVVGVASTRISRRGREVATDAARTSSQPARSSKSAHTTVRRHATVDVASARSSALTELHNAVIRSAARCSDCARKTGRSRDGVSIGATSKRRRIRIEGGLDARDALAGTAALASCRRPGASRGAGCASAAAAAASCKNPCQIGMLGAVHGAGASIGGDQLHWAQFFATSGTRRTS